MTRINLCLSSKKIDFVHTGWRTSPVIIHFRQSDGRSDHGGSDAGIAAGQAYIRTPCIHADMQEAGCTDVVEPGHAKGSRITLQLRHGYRAKAFSRRGIAYLHIAEPGRADGVELSDAFRYRVSCWLRFEAYPLNGRAKSPEEYRIGIHLRRFTNRF